MTPPFPEPRAVAWPAEMGFSSLFGNSMPSFLPLLPITLIPLFPPSLEEPQAFFWWLSHSYTHRFKTSCAPVLSHPKRGSGKRTTHRSESTTASTETLDCCPAPHVHLPISKAFLCTCMSACPWGPRSHFSHLCILEWTPNISIPLLHDPMRKEPPVPQRPRRLE